jgi:hypothetical protein
MVDRAIAYALMSTNTLEGWLAMMVEIVVVVINAEIWKTHLKNTT